MTTAFISYAGQGNAIVLLLAACLMNAGLVQCAPRNQLTVAHNNNNNKRATDTPTQQAGQRWVSPSTKVLRVGEPCTKPDDCALIARSTCDPLKNVCSCPKEHPVDGGNQCGQGRQINETCQFTAECHDSDRNLECKDAVCQCAFGFQAAVYTGGNVVCTSLTKPDGVGSHVDPTMIGVLIGLILMFIIMCVVLRLFSKARWRENRTIFNTPNPRLANASLLKEVNTKHQQPGSRRGSLAPARNGANSRQPSLASIPRSVDASVQSRRASFSRFHVPLATSNATQTDAKETAGCSSSETDKLLDPHQISVHVDHQAVSAL